MLWQLWVLGSTRAATSGAQREQRGRRQGDARVRASCTRRRLVRRTSTPAASAEQRTATNAVCKQHVEVNVAVQVRRRDRATHGARAAAVGDAEVAMVKAVASKRAALRADPAGRDLTLDSLAGSARLSGKRPSEASSVREHTATAWLHAREAAHEAAHEAKTNCAGHGRCSEAIITLRGECGSRSRSKQMLLNVHRGDRVLRSLPHAKMRTAHDPNAAMSGLVAQKQSLSGVS